MLASKLAIFFSRELQFFLLLVEHFVSFDVLSGWTFCPVVTFAFFSGPTKGRNYSQSASLFRL